MDYELESKIDIVKNEIQIPDAAQRLAIDKLAEAVQINNDETDSGSGTHSKEKFVSVQAKKGKKHKCVMSKVSEINIAAELCTEKSPAYISFDKMCLHYVIHYIKRGTWDKLIPELKEEDKPRIEGFQCNVCAKKFRNNHSRGEYPARGSFICHWATEHGKVVEAMREDKLVEMDSVLELFKLHDQRIKKFIENGTKTNFDKNPATVMESLSWRIKNSTQTLPQKNSRSKPIIKCPKCNKFDKNRCPNNLKLHIFHHYLDFWKEKIPDIDGKETVCEQCSPSKKIVGANSDGCRTALICHRAIQHDELRGALENDPTLPDGFVEKLYGEQNSKPVKVLKVNERTRDNAENSSSDNVDISQERVRIAEEVRKREFLLEYDRNDRSKENNSEKTSKKRRNEDKLKELEKILEAKMNSNIEQLPYVGKRIKQNLQNINFDDDSEDDDDWSKRAKTDFADKIPSLNKIKPRERLPRRQVAPTNLSEKVQEMSDDDEDNDNL